jgi:putative membrane protein
MIHSNSVWLQGAFLSGTMFFYIALPGTGNVTKQAIVKSFAAELNEAKGDTTDSEKNAAFLISAAEINLDEIMLGEQAQQKSKMPDIIELGKMMVKDHRQLQDELTSLARKQSITLPTSADNDAEAAYKKFNNASGADFDIEYCDMMVNGHRKAIQEFENESLRPFDHFGVFIFYHYPASYDSHFINV